MQISWLKKEMQKDGEMLSKSAKEFGNWIREKTQRVPAPEDKAPLEEDRTDEEEKMRVRVKAAAKERKIALIFEVLIAMATIPVMVGVVLWTASQLAGLMNVGDQGASLHGEPSPFYSSSRSYETGGLRRELLRKEDAGAPAMFLVSPEQHFTPSRMSSNYPRAPPGEVRASLNYGRDILGRSSRLEMNLESAEMKVMEGSAEHGQLMASYPKKESLRRHGNGLLAARASLHLTHTLCKRFGFKGDKCSEFVSTIGIGDTDLGKHCDWKNGGENGVVTSANVICHNESPYRTADGSCNNLKNPSLGKTYSGYRRLLFPKYADGVQLMRRSVSGQPLPSARYVSTSLAPDLDRPDEFTTLSLMQWTQFVEHDLAHTPSAMMLSNGASIICCREDGFPLSPRYHHPSCAPVDIPADDPFYAEHRQRCMNYVRSITTIRPGCTLGPSEQVNQATHFLDASMIYGPDSETQRTVRSYEGGRLKSTQEEIVTTKGKRSVEFFPQFSEPLDICQGISLKGHHCYHGGDSRSTEHPQLTILHTLWLREHNRLANKLSELNSHWNDEKLFQEARKIVIAQLQHITYSEWLPNVIGFSYFKRMFPEKKTPETDYNKNTDPSTSNEFASAAIRFARSMMDSNIRLYEENREMNDTIQLRDNYNQPMTIKKSGYFDSLVRGMAAQNSQQMDLLFTRDVTSLLWREKKPYGLDVISLDIQRGRDHGLQPYNRYRELCGLPLAKDFDDLLDVIPKTVVGKLRKLYQNVNDIDLYVGGMSEIPIQELKDSEMISLVDGRKYYPGKSLVGPTFQCIIGEQMLRTKLADRHFYDNEPENETPIFSKNQLEQLKKVSLARLFCDNGNEIMTMQRNVFQKPLQSNPISACDDYEKIPALDLNYWVETA